MAVDPRYITTNTLEPYFVDKTTGAPLAGGIVSFFIDTNRAVPKLVYELTALPPYPPAPPAPALNPSFTALPNPIILSSVGTIQDAAGNNVALYYFPYDAAGNPELYYITVTDSFGVEQFTREGWPFIGNANVNPVGLNTANISNQLSNPQFAEVLFIPTAPYVISFAGAGQTIVDIAPDWKIIVTSNGAGTVTLTQNSIAGATAYPHNPPYTLTVAPGVNVVGLTISQRLNTNPDIFSPQVGGANGWISGSILLAPASSAIISYAPSTGAQQIIVNANNLSGVYAEFNNTIQLAPATNPDNSNVGFVDIIVSLPVGAPTTFSNLQIVGLETNIPNIIYNQNTVNRQIDQLFNFYNPLLQYKAISSYLTGWNFAQNPGQFLGRAIIASAAGANTSKYFLDQLILFQSANNGIHTEVPPSGALACVATNATQFALIQYLPQSITRVLLNQRLSVNIAAATSVLAGMGGTVSLWYTNDVNLPSCAAGNSIVATLTAAGKPATFNGNWVEVPRSGLNDAQFTITIPTTRNFPDYGFSGWDLRGGIGITTATFFAIVVGFGNLPAGQNVTFESISLVPGDIPTRPAPLTFQQTFADCCHYYQKSFFTTTVPATNVGVQTGEAIAAQTSAALQNSIGPVVTFQYVMVRTPSVILYNPAANNAQIRSEGAAADWTLSGSFNESTKGFATTGTTSAGSNIGNFCGVHWTADSRLGA